MHEHHTLTLTHGCSSSHGPTCRTISLMAASYTLRCIMIPIFHSQVPRILTSFNARCYSTSSRKRPKQDDGSVSDNVLVRSIVSIVRKTDRWDVLLKDLCVASASEITPPIAVQAIKRIKKPMLALKFFEWLEHHQGFDHDSLTYSAILKVLTRDCNPSQASCAHSLLCKKKQLGLNVSPADYNYVIHQWASVGRSDMALQLLDEMVAQDCTPSVTSCTVLLKALFDSRREDLAWQLFDRMLDGKINALSIDIETFNVAMKALCIRGELERAFKIFDKMKAENYVPDLDTFNILIKGCCETGEVNVVCDLFKQMIGIGVKPDSYTVNMLIKELCKQGKPESGNYLFNYMRNVGWLDKKFVYAQLVESLCIHGWWMKALKVFVKMVRRGHHPKACLYCDLVRRLCMGSREREAFKLKDLMLSKGYLPEIKVYNGLIDGLCMIGRMEAVSKLLLELHDKGLELNLETYNTVLRGYSMLKNVNSTLEWIEKIKEKGWELNKDPCNSLIACLSAEGRMDEALRLKNLIQEGTNMDHDEVSHEIIINDLVPHKSSHEIVFAGNWGSKNT